MKKCIIAAMMVLAVVGCERNANSLVSNTASDPHNAQTALDWTGEYTGTQPCADCSGIETSLILNKDGTFVLNERYQGKDSQPFVNAGRFDWNDKGDTITLNLSADQSVKYFVGEHRIFRLDQQGKRISGDLADAYTLTQNLHD